MTTLIETGQEIIRRDIDAFNTKLIESLHEREDVQVIHTPLEHQCGTYDFLKIRSRDIGPDDKIIVIRASLHGDEIAGAYSMLYHIDKIFDYAHGQGVKLIVYPLANPSGFERNVRYNGDGDKGDYVNNHFLQYELADGTFVKDIEESNEFKRWYWASDPQLHIRLAAETALLHKLLKEDPLTQVAAVIDLHQDYFTEGAGPASYHYANEHPEVYQAIVDKIAAIIPILGNTDIGAGFNTSMISDANGFILRHDGSLPDLLYRMGVIHGITPETTGATPLDLACQVNLTWILGIIDLVSRPKNTE